MPLLNLDLDTPPKKNHMDAKNDWKHVVFFGFKYGIIASGMVMKLLWENGRSNYIRWVQPQKFNELTVAFWVRIAFYLDICEVNHSFKKWELISSYHATTPSMSELQSDSDIDNHMA